MGGNFILGIGIVLLSLIGFVPHANIIPVCSVIAIATAIGGPMKDIPFATLRQTVMPPDDVPAAMRAYLTVHSGSMLVGLLLTPMLIGEMTVLPFIAACGTLTIGISAIGFCK